MSRFVSGGTDEEPTKRDDAWLKAQQELDAAAVAKQEAARAGSGKSLYETLQANKAAKQEAFEEATKLTNQFRSLDEDEIEFLDSVQESARAKELAERKDTKESLEEFRKQQEEAERAAKEQDGAASPPTVSESWAAGPRKRKKGKENSVLGGVKIRRTSTGEKAKSTEDTPKAEAEAEVDGLSAATGTTKPPVVEKAEQKPAVSTSPSPSPPAATVGLGLGAYSSDED